MASRRRGSRTASHVDPFCRREIKVESGLEAAWLAVLIASPRYAKVEEQQKLLIPVRGEMVEHWMDFKATRWDGTVDALSVKYSNDAKLARLEEILVAAASNVGDQFAHRWAILKETGLTRTMVWNACRVIACAKDYDYEAQDYLAAMLARSEGRISLRKCDAMLGDGRRGSRAAIALIKTGKVAVTKGERIGNDTVIRNLFTT